MLSFQKNMLRGAEEHAIQMQTWAAVESTGVIETGPDGSPPGLPRDDVKEPARLFSTPVLFLLSFTEDGAPVKIRQSLT